MAQPMDIDSHFEVRLNLGLKIDETRYQEEVDTLHLLGTGNDALGASLRFPSCDEISLARKFRPAVSIHLFI